MLDFGYNSYQILSAPAAFSPMQWTSFELYDWLPKWPRYGPNPFLFNPFTFSYKHIAWHSRYATVFPHSKRYRMSRAIATNDLQQIKKLLDSGFPVDCVIDQKYGYTALQLAATNNHYPLIQMLALRGAEVNLQDRWGNTPLAIAVTNHNHEAIHSLMRNGSDPQIKNNYGFSAVDKADPSIKEFLTSFTDQRRGFPRFRVKLRIQGLMRAPFWEKVAGMAIYSGRVRQNLMSRWQFDFTDNRTVEELLGKAPELLDFYIKA